jgi:hypothetical protein
MASASCSVLLDSVPMPSAAIAVHLFDAYLNTVSIVLHLSGLYYFLYFSHISIIHYTVVFSWHISKIPLLTISLHTFNYISWLSSICSYRFYNGTAEWSFHCHFIFSFVCVKKGNKLRGLNPWANSTRTSESVARKSDHYTTEAVKLILRFDFRENPAFPYSLQHLD